MMRFSLVLLLATQPALAQVVATWPTLQLQSGLRVSGTVEASSDGRLWLVTPQGARLLMPGLGAPGTTVTVEYPAGATRVVAIGRDTLTLVSAQGYGQIPLTLVPASAYGGSTVEVRYADGKLAMLPLGQAMTLYTSNQAAVVLPEPGYAWLKTPSGLTLVNLMPYLTFKDGITEYGTVQKKAELKGTQEVYVLTSHGDQLAAPVQWVENGHANWSDLNIGDRVSVDIPSGTTVQLREMFGKEAQFRGADGRLLQLPFRVVPERSLEEALVGVRQLNGDVTSMSLKDALAGDQSRAHMILLPGVPGVTYVLTATGIYDLTVETR